MKLAIYVPFVVAALGAGFIPSDVTHCAAVSLDIPKVEHCALVANPAQYDGKEIRLLGVYLVSGTYDSKFFSSSCNDETLGVEFDSAYRSCSKPRAFKSMVTMTRNSGARKRHGSVVRMDYRAADVEFVGMFTASNPSKPSQLPQGNSPLSPGRSVRESYDFIFHVKCVVRVKPLPKGAKY